MNLLENIDTPDDLKKLKESDLPELAAEIRKYLIDSISKTGGHLAPSLGTVELTLALHYCYNTPEDKLIWDVGHQAYTHKIITGRKDRFHTIRQTDGLSGFPRISESRYDALSVGHAGTSISAALGIAKARDLRKEKYKVLSVIGDGSMTSGLAFEGMNNLGTENTQLTIILNDNSMSISPNVGALSRYLTKIITDKRIQKLKDDIWNLAGKIPRVGDNIRDLGHYVDENLKMIITQGKLFENLGINYYGPIDGHDIDELLHILNFVKSSGNAPALIHVITQKGKGYHFAENDATKYHGIGSFSKDTGNTKKTSKISYSTVFGKTLKDIADNQENVTAITAAMPDGTSLNDFKESFPDRFFDVGIAEGHAVTFAAGQALNGMKPVVAIYSTFIQRAYDSIIHDIALDNLNVVVCLDRAGIVGKDGPTHHGNFDISFLRAIPNITIMAPSSGIELRNMLYTAVTKNLGPVFIRYPRGSGKDMDLNAAFTDIPHGRMATLKKGKKCAVISAGSQARVTIEKALPSLAQNGIDPEIVDARFVKPLDKNRLDEISENFSHVVTIESNSESGGFGSAVSDYFHDTSKTIKNLRIAYPDRFLEHGNTEEITSKIGLDSKSVADRITSFVGK